MYKEEFVSFASEAKEKRHYIGIGNPNAKILFVGKEPSNRDEHYSNNAKFWSNLIAENKADVYQYDVAADHVFRKEKSWGKNTWSKYQKLTNLIYQEPDIPYRIDFLENVFTTEINDSPSKNTSTADKSSLNERKNLFKESEFIQSFPVVLLACSNYIVNQEGKKEIEEIFNVSYHDDFPKKRYNASNWFYSHYNHDRTKLVIHTRQLSGQMRNELLHAIAEVIREHLIRLNILKNNSHTF